MNLKSLLLLFLLTISGVVTLGAPSQFPLIEFENIADEDQKKVEDWIKQKKLTQLRAYDIDQIIMLIGTNIQYQKIDAFLTPQQNYVIRGEKLNRIKSITLTGAKKIDKSEILKALPLRPDSEFDKQILGLAVENIKELYGRKGYFNTQVELTYSEKNLAQTELEIKITEGEPCQIYNIVIESPNKKLVQELQKKVRKFRRKYFSEDLPLKLERTMNDYLVKNRYLNTRIEQKKALYNSARTQATLFYTTTNPYRYDLIFNKNSYFSSGDIYRIIKIKEFEKSSADPAADIIKIITQEYLQRGFPFIKVTVTEKTNETLWTRSLQFDVEEGPRTKIKKFDISGRFSRPIKYYREFIRKHSSPIVRQGYFVRADIELGLKNLITNLNNEGFLRARLHTVRYEFSEDQKYVVLKIIIDEGPLTQLRAIFFEGNSSYSDEQLLQVMRLKANTPLQLNELEDAVRRLENFYTSHGFIEMKINTQPDQLVQYDARGSQATLQIKINEGPAVSIKNILVEGNSMTRDYVILKNLELNVGDTLTPKKLEESKRRLERLGYFARVDLRTLEEGTQISERTLIITVSEQDPGIFRIGFGVNNNERLTLRGFTGASYNNLYGTGRGISGRINIQNNIVKIRYNEYEASLSYLEPFIFDTRFRGRAIYSREQKVLDFVEKDNKEEVKVQVSDKLGLIAERDINSNIRFSWNTWTFESVREFTDRDNITNFKSSEQNIVTVGPIVEFDYRDNPLLPTKGFYVRLDADYSDPHLGSSSKINFYRTQSTLSHYLRLYGPQFLWANSFRSGYGRNISDENGSGIPQSYAFFLGGYTTLRGFSGTPNDRIPSEKDFKTANKDQLIVPKETSYYLVKSEIRFPIYSLLGGVVFTDLGNVRINRSGSSPGFNEPMRQTYGLGIRINTPVGPLSLDYGRKVDYDKREKESPDQWHLSVGTF